MIGRIAEANQRIRRAISLIHAPGWSTNTVSWLDGHAPARAMSRYAVFAGPLVLPLAAAAAHEPHAQHDSRFADRPSAITLAGLDIERVMDALQRAVPIPQHEIRMRGALRRQILRQRLPLRAHIEDRVQNFADVHLAPTPTAFGRRYRRFDQRPFAVAQITRVAQPMAVGSRRCSGFHIRHPSAATRVPGKE